MKRIACFPIVLFLMLCWCTTCLAQQRRSGNPIFPGWYADPEAVVFGKKCWVFPTYSAEYDKQLLI